MTQPKFAIDEVVILRADCKEDMGYDGEYTVLGFGEIDIHGFARVQDKLYSFGEEYAGTYAYCLDIGMAAQEGILFKKHIPGELSFSELMNSLKNPVAMEA